MDWKVPRLINVGKSWVCGQESFVGGIVGGAVTLMFAFTLPLVLTSFFMNIAAISNNVVVGFITLLLALVVGGFLAGLIGRQDSHKAGLIVGITTS